MLTIRRVVGPSMQPAYRPGAVVLGVGWVRPRVGSVVIAERHGQEIIKRVTAISEKGLYLQGDNHAQSTDSRVYGWFAPQSIKGVVVGRVKR